MLSVGSTGVNQCDPLPHTLGTVRALNCIAVTIKDCQPVGFQEVGMCCTRGDCEEYIACKSGGPPWL